MTVPARVQLERDNALIDVQRVVAEYGADFIFYVRSESTVTRDSYNSLKNKSIVSTIKKEMKAHPVLYQPERNEITKAGLSEVCDCVIYTAMKDWTDMSLTFHDIETALATVDLNNERYVIKEKGLAEPFADTHLYITIGLSKE